VTSTATAPGGPRRPPRHHVHRGVGTVVET
jgi:hypothetical protein